VRKISEYNQKFVARKLNPNHGHRYLPYIVVVIDEFADMIMTAGKEVETPIVRLGQLARAIGIHMIIATQRPDAKVITGLISANCPSRIAFKVTNRINSQIILGGTGAEKLIGDGDMLVQINGVDTRLQCAFLDTPEIERITDFVAKQRSFPSAYLLPDYVPEGGEDVGGTKEDMGDLDSMFEEIARFVVANQQGSTSFVQRRFKIGYNRAGRIMDQLEQAGIVGKSEGSKPREVLITDPSALERLLNDIYIDNL
jgi:S-DNA-T family DNA segregation ATPase FtsK/SpoIIIE